MSLKNSMMKPGATHTSTSRLHSGRSFSSDSFGSQITLLFASPPLITLDGGSISLFAITWGDVAQTQHAPYMTGHGQNPYDYVDDDAQAPYMAGHGSNPPYGYGVGVAQSQYFAPVTTATAATTHSSRPLPVRQRPSTGSRPQTPVGGAASQVVQGKSRQPADPAGGGNPQTPPEQIRTHERSPLRGKPQATPARRSESPQDPSRPSGADRGKAPRQTVKVKLTKGPGGTVTFTNRNGDKQQTPRTDWTEVRGGSRTFYVREGRKVTYTADTLPK